MAGTPCDLLVYGAHQLIDLASGHPALPTLRELEASAPRQKHALAIHEGRIAAIGPESELRAQFEVAATLDAQGGVVVPGFVDGHTHPAFAVGRAEEFDWRAQGMDYVEIARRGGGILSSVRAVREVDEAVLSSQVEAHFRRMQRHGTTACEAKSGYGLDTEAELKSLRAIRTAAERTGMTVYPTFLGAHMIPLEHREQPDRYLDILCQEMLPAVKEAGLARAADVFIEDHAFDLARSRRYLERAQELGFALRVHADQFEGLGATRLAVELGAECADHLEQLDEAGCEALAASGKTYAGLLPTVPHFLRQEADAPARRLLERGVPYFVATDFNPGSSYTPSIPEALHFARIRLNLSAIEALAGATVFAAASLGVADRKGRLLVGFDADLLVLDLPDLFHLGYAMGENPVREVVVGGRRLELGSQG